MHLELRNDIRELATAMGALQDFARSTDLDKAASQAAELVLDELLSNIIRHGHTAAGAQPITLDLDVREGSLHIRISDGGIPFNPFDRPPPNLDLPIEEREPGGLGIHLVRHFMDDYSYSYQDERNVVTLRKGLAPDTA